jgi:hypothetical protein
MKGPMDPTSLILPKYTNSNDPPYEITVDSNKDDLKYEIESLPGMSGAAAAAKSTPVRWIRTIFPVFGYEVGRQFWWPKVPAFGRITGAAFR